MTNWEYEGFTANVNECDDNCDVDCYLWKCPDCGYVIRGNRETPTDDCPYCEFLKEEKIDEVKGKY